MVWTRRRSANATQGGVPHHGEPVITTADLKSLRTELNRHGVFEHRTRATWGKLIALLAAFFLIAGAAVLSPWWWLALPLILLSAIPAACAAMIGHEAAHGSFAVGKLHNEIALHLIFPLFTGLGAQYWKHKHNHRHHAHPNVVGSDPDVDIWPMALSSSAYRESGRLRRWFTRRLQPYLFWPLTLFLAFVMRLQSWSFVVARVRARGFDRGLAADIAFMAAHYTLWLVAPAFWFGALPVVTFYLVLWGTVGFLLALVFAPAHIGMPVHSAGGKGWIHQLETTRNFRLPRVVSWFFIGLDFQVEHHLFPRIPHQQLALASQVTRGWCGRLGLPHHQIGYGAALADATRHLRVSWRDVPLE